jgi:hypothetical protein
LISLTKSNQIKSFNTLHLEVIANTVVNTVAKLTNSVFAIAYLLRRVAYMSDLLIDPFVKGQLLEIQANRRSLYVIRGLLGSLGRPINTGYFPLNKGSSLKNNTALTDLLSLQALAATFYNLTLKCRGSTRKTPLIIIEQHFYKLFLLEELICDETESRAIAQGKDSNILRI